MKETILKLKQIGLSLLLIFLLAENTTAQYKDFKLLPDGDTLNIVDGKGLKQGKWVATVGEVRGEPGYDEEGMYKDDKKTGMWRRYNANGDIIAVENYIFGGKDGLQQYFNFLGVIERQEEWRGYNPDAPYDTIAIYGTGSNEIIEHKRVKAEQYSVPHGEWKYFDAGGRVTKTQHYDRGRPMVEEGTEPAVTAAPAKPKEKVKTKEILEYEKKYSKKKRTQMEREGKTSL